MACRLVSGSTEVSVVDSMVGTDCHPNYGCMKRGIFNSAKQTFKGVCWYQTVTLLWSGIP